MCDYFDTQVRKAGEELDVVIQNIIDNDGEFARRGVIGLVLDTVLLDAERPNDTLAYALNRALGDKPDQGPAIPSAGLLALVREAIKGHDEYAVVKALTDRLKEEGPENLTLVSRMLAENYLKRVQRAASPVHSIQALFEQLLNSSAAFDETDESTHTRRLHAQPRERRERH